MKSTRMIMLVLLISLCSAMSAYATEPKSLDEVTATVQETTAAVEETRSSEKATSGGKTQNNNSFIDGLSNAANLSIENDQAKSIGTAMNKVGSLVFQVAGYILSIGLGILIAIDLVYIAIPPLRVFLANGYVGNAQAGNPQMQQGAMGGMGMGGMNSGMGGMGMGGMGGGFGGGFGGGRFGGGMGMGGAMGGMNGMAGQNQPANGRMQWVSNAALNAVATETAGQSAFKIYIKQTAILCIVAPLLLVLASTGVLANIGFAAGGALSNALSNIKF